MYRFAYRRPKTLEEAVRWFREFEEPHWLAGGMTLLPLMKLRLAVPGALIDLNFIEGLKGIRASGGRLSVGAMTRHADVQDSPEIARALPALTRLAGGIGDPQVRNRGTIGGSISYNDSAADYPAALVALNATIRTNKREIAADRFFTGLYQTCLERDELVTEIEFPLPDCAAYAKFPHPASGFAVVGVMVARFGEAVRAAVTGAAPCVFRLTALEEALSKSFEPGAAESVAPDPGAMKQPDAEYRAHLTKVMARRAIESAIAGW